MGYWTQIKALLQKNILLAKRNKFGTAVKLGFPLLCIISCYFVTADVWIRPSVPKVNSVGSLPKCEGKQCANTLYYAPETPLTAALMQTLGNLNVPALKHGKDISSTSLEYEDFRNYVFNQAPGSTTGGIFFDEIDNLTISYKIVYNETWSGQTNQYDIQVAVDNAILKYYTNTQLGVGLASFPSVSNGNIYTYFILQTVVPLFVYMAFTMILYTITNSVLPERQNNLRGYLRCFGLNDGTYWLSWFIFFFAIHLLVTVAFLATCYAIPGLRYFRETNFFVHLMTFVIYGFALVSQGLFLSVVLRSVIANNIIVSLMFFCGVSFSMTFIFISTPIYGWWSPSIGFGWHVPLYLLYTLPFFYFIIISTEITIGSIGLLVYEGDLPFAPGFKWSDITKHPDDGGHVPTVLTCTLLLLLLGFVYLFLAWYLDSVLYDTQGRRKSLIFFLRPSYWKPNTSLKTSKEKGLVVSKISKAYSGGIHALKKVSFQMNEGSVCVLLGRNGAGKTTLLNILMGLSTPDSGSAYIRGYNLKTHLANIRSSLGVCFQTDAYWPELTPNEHMRLLGSLKSLPNLEEEISSKLRELKLSKVANSQVKTFSGGMRRRLTVAISMLGDPAVIMLDEPTTGIDVMNQKCLWDAVNNLKKKGTIVLLVTHSDAEANAVADKVVLLHDSEVKADGAVSKIKEKFGINTIHILLDVSRSDEIKNEFMAIAPELNLVAENAGSIVFGFTKLENSRALIRFLQNEPAIKDWKISNGNIDSAFMIVK